MKLLSKAYICIFFLSFSFILLNAAELVDFEWGPITDTDWDVTVDSAYTVNGAIVLLEEIESDDTKLISQRCIYTEHKKIRIINDKGRNLANLSIPYSKNQKFKVIKARSIQKDGTITEIKDSEIYDKTIYKQKRKKLYQKNVFIPGVTDDCIIEYYFKIVQKSPEFYWPISSGYYTKKAVYTWNFYRGAGLSDETYEMNDLTPNYLCINCDDNMEIEKLPSIKNVESLRFITRDQKPFDSEKYTLPDPALNSNVLMFYAGNETSSGYWGKKSEAHLKVFQKFGKKNKKILPIVKEFNALLNDTEKIEAAYSWLQDNIKNLSYVYSTDDFKDIKSVDDLMKYRYGYSTAINKTFYDMLREMNIEANIVYVVDRDENIFQMNAKFWQFDNVYIMVTNDEGNNTFYNPGIKFLPCGEVPWYNEGGNGLRCGNQNEQFIIIPFSAYDENKSTIRANLSLDEEMILRGSIEEQHTGELAHELRSKYSECTPREQLDLMKDNSYLNYSAVKQDSFKIISSLEKDRILKYQYNIELPIAHFKSDKLQMFRVSDLLKQYPVHFKTSTRKHSVIFEYANTQKEIFYIDLPNSYSVKALPEAFSYSTQVGSVQIEVSSMNKTKLQIVRIIDLRTTYLKTEYFPTLYQFSKALDNLNNDTIILQAD